MAHQINQDVVKAMSPGYTVKGFIADEKSGKKNTREYGVKRAPWAFINMTEGKEKG